LGCLNKFRTGEARKRTSNLIELFGFWGREKALVSELTVGEQRRLDLARALVSEPEMVLLDEVMSGLTEVQAKEISDIIRQFNGRGTTFLLVEHVMRVVMNLCHRIVVLDQGKIIASGIPADVSTNPDVIRVYLGQ
jgi:branched-chain amino acid transport system ATP-binding protein